MKPGPTQAGGTCSRRGHRERRAPRQKQLHERGKLWRRFSPLHLFKNKKFLTVRQLRARLHLSL